MLAYFNTNVSSRDILKMKNSGINVVSSRIQGMQAAMGAGRGKNRFPSLPPVGQTCLGSICIYVHTTTLGMIDNVPMEKLTVIIVQSYSGIWNAPAASLVSVWVSQALERPG